MTYPKRFATHNRTQLYYFDSHGMQRRMDYHPEVNGFAPTARYTYAELAFDITGPTQRRTYNRRGPSADRSCTPITLGS